MKSTVQPTPEAKQSRRHEGIANTPGGGLPGAVIMQAAGGQRSPEVSGVSTGWWMRARPEQASKKSKQQDSLWLLPEAGTPRATRKTHLRIADSRHAAEKLKGNHEGRGCG